MDQWIELRRKIRNEQIPLRQLERDTGIHRETLRKIRDNSQPPGYRRARPVPKSKIGPYTVVPITVTSFTSFFYSVKRDRMASRYNTIYLAVNCFVVQVMHFFVVLISAIACTEKWWAEASHHCSLFEKTFFDKTISLKIIYGCNPHMFCMHVHICDIG